MSFLRQYAVQGKSARAIARELGLSRNSVRKVLRTPNSRTIPAAVGF